MTLCAGPASLPIRVSVENDLSNMTPETYSSSVVEGGVLLGALRRLQEAQQDFKYDHPWHFLSYLCLSSFILKERAAVSPTSLSFFKETVFFRFTVKEDPNFGLLLESVNGVAGSEQEQTYWEILSESSGEYSRLDVGEYMLPWASVQHFSGILNEL